MIIPSTLHTHNHECTCGNLYHAACSYLSKSTLCNYCAIKPLRQCNDWLRCWHGAGNVTQSPRLILHSKLQCFPHSLNWLWSKVKGQNITFLCPKFKDREIPSLPWKFLQMSHQIWQSWTKDSDCSCLSHARKRAGCRAKNQRGNFSGQNWLQGSS